MAVAEETPLAGFQKKYLRGRAHGLKPVVMVGQKGASPALFASIETALTDHELIKIRFVDHKDHAAKEQIIAAIADRTGARIAGTIGHTAVFFRPHPDPDKRRIDLPRKNPA